MFTCFFISNYTKQAKCDLCCLHFRRALGATLSVADLIIIDVCRSYEGLFVLRTVLLNVVSENRITVFLYELLQNGLVITIARLKNILYLLLLMSIPC